MDQTCSDSLFFKLDRQMMKNQEEGGWAVL